MTAPSGRPAEDQNETKAALRLDLKDRRAALPDGYRREASIALKNTILALLQSHAPSCVAGYIPIGAEADVRPVLSALSDTEIQVCLPAIVSEAEPLSFRRYNVGDPLIAGPNGTQQVDVGGVECWPDFVLVPLLGFDLSGHRLGWGAGFYDRTLKALRSNGAVKAIGVGFDCQEVALEPDPWDEPLDIIVTETRLNEVTR